MDLLIILVLILLNGVFAMSELALVLAKRVRLDKMAAEGRSGARPTASRPSTRSAACSGKGPTPACSTKPNRPSPRAACWNSCASGSGSWLQDGAMPLAHLREVLGIGEALPGEAGGAYQTLAGFVLEQLGHVPAVSDSFVWERYRFEVVDMDRHRIGRVLATEAGEAGGAAPARPRCAGPAALVRAALLPSTPRQGAGRGVDGWLACITGRRACRRLHCAGPIRAPSRPRSRPVRTAGSSRRHC
ncbi:transporter associated domain-containing protein [Massilia antarctica]|nr:transporter associated domain-containing protein [Massilia antarctica]